MNHRHPFDGDAAPETIRGYRMAFIHPTADVSPQAEIGEGTRVWHGAQIRERARLGRGCIVGKNVYLDC